MKFILIDGQRRVLAQSSEQYQASKPKKEWCEIDPEIWYECMIRGMKRILKDERAERLKGIGITGQMHTLIPVNKDGKAVRLAIMWNDMRTKGLLPELKRVFRNFKEGKYLAETVSTGSPAAGLYWMKKEEPKAFAAMDKFLIGPDYLVYRLTGEYTTDYCEASTSCLFNLKERAWSKDVQKFLGLSDSIYPRLGASSEIAGLVGEETAKKLGISKAVFVIHGTGDNPAAAISTGCLGKGYPVISLGTSGILMMPVSKLTQEAKGKRILLALEKGSFQYLVQGAVQSTGNTLDWWIKNICGELDYGSLEENCLPAELSEDEVLFYPHLMGEKTIYGNPSLRGAFLGLGMESTRKSMTYAVLEGLSMGFRELAEKMQIPLDQFDSIKVVGGGANNDTWLQILANVLHKRIERLEGVTGAAYGIALLALFRDGGIDKMEDLSSGLISVQKQFVPDERVMKKLDARYEKYCRIYHALGYLGEDKIV